MSVAVVIVAAGRGSRAGGDVPKQWRRLGDRSVAAWTVEIFASHPGILRQVLVLHPEDIEAGLWPGASGVEVVAGGASRVQSVRAGLSALEGGCSHVLIHDVARPLVSHEVIDRVLAALETHKGAAPALAITDALWRGNTGLVTGTEDRNGLFRAQTPQGFEMDAILAAHESYSGEAADDVEIARAAGIEVAIVEGDAANLKITAPGDFARAEAVLRERRGAEMDIRLGNGFDVHRFGPGDHVMLCGVRVAHERGLQGHSDADVGMHAVTDAIYGALAEGDIGRHFPPSDPHWKGADSAVFLAHAAALAREKGYRIGNVDCTLICEVPKIAPHAGAMQERMGEIMELEGSRVSVKATTSEKLGFTGRGEGIAALATVTLVRA